MSRIALVLFALFVPALALASKTAPASKIYPAGSFFAWDLADCPPGSVVIGDPLYVEAGRKSGVIYCRFTPEAEPAVDDADPAVTQNRRVPPGHNERSTP